MFDLPSLLGATEESYRLGLVDRENRQSCFFVKDLLAFFAAFMIHTNLIIIMQFSQTKKQKTCRTLRKRFFENLRELKEE
ncbi:hypothetical protein GT50_14395 [Geobacillus stearothermophilus 10]|nr:hypothetical protein GT50_14395 [Geobacillus stearothermophilus 10]